MRRTWRAALAGRAAGRGDRQHRLRAFALLLGCAAVALTALTWQVAGAVHHERELRLAARSAVGDARHPRLLLSALTDFAGDRSFTAVYLQPLRKRAPLPPGVEHWPAPGEALLSPALRAAGDGIEHRYGRVAGTIGPRGLATPGELLAYIRPPDGTISHDEANRVSGFGMRAGETDGTVSEAPRPLGDFVTLMLVVLALPAAALAVVAARTGSPARDRRAGLLRALGARRRDLLAFALGESALPVLAGLVTACALGASLLAGDTRLPWIGFVVPAADLRAHAAALAGTVPAAALGTWLLAALAAPRPKNNSTRPTAVRSGRAVRRAAWLLLPSQLLLAWYPSLFPVPAETPLSLPFLAAALIGSLACLPAAPAVLLAALGRPLAALGLRAGRPALLLAGKRLRTSPGRTARLLAGPVIAAGIVSFMQVYPSVPDAYAAEARHSARAAAGSIVPLETRHPERLPALAARLPRDAGLAVLRDREPSGRAPQLSADCATLAALDTPCDATGRPGHVGPRAGLALQEIGALPRAAVADAARTPDAADSPGSYEPVVLLVSRTGDPLDLDALRTTATAVLGPRTVLLPLGWNYTAGFLSTEADLRWVTFLGALGVAALLAAFLTGALGEALRTAHTLAPTAAVGGSPRLLTACAAVEVLLPLTIAALASPLYAAWLNSPLTTPPRQGSLPTALLQAVSAVLLLLALAAGAATALAGHSAVRRWRPAGE